MRILTKAEATDIIINLPKHRDITISKSRRKLFDETVSSLDIVTVKITAKAIAEYSTSRFPEYEDLVIEEFCYFDQND